MSEDQASNSTLNLSAVVRRLDDLVDLAERGIREAPRRVYPLAALLLGSVASPESAEARDTAAALELMDVAIIEHYYEAGRPVDERLLAGDYRYACGMRVVAGLGRPELVETLARATADVARGHTLAVNETKEDVLALRSALWPAAVRLAAMVSSDVVTETAVLSAQELGSGREAALAGVEGAAARLEGLACEMLREKDDVCTHHAELVYLARVLCAWPAG